MFCPVCGKQQVSNQTRFCSGCGFPLTGVSEVIAAGGASLVKASSGANQVDSPRKHGIKQGAMVMLVGCFLVVPLVAILSAALDITPVFVPIFAILGFMGGLMRIIYALMFQSGQAQMVLEPGEQNHQLNAGSQRGLPPQTSYPITDLSMPVAGRWRDSADLSPGSVTESTTKLLEKEEGQ